MENTVDDRQFDVIAVSTDTNRVLWVDGPKTAANAEAIIKMAILRQGVDDRFFSYAPTGTYKAGDTWEGNGGV